MSDRPALLTHKMAMADVGRHDGGKADRPGHKDPAADDVPRRATADLVRNTLATELTSTQCPSFRLDSHLQMARVARAWRQHRHHDVRFRYTLVRALARHSHRGRRDGGCSRCDAGIRMQRRSSRISAWWLGAQCCRHRGLGRLRCAAFHQHVHLGGHDGQACTSHQCTRSAQRMQSGGRTWAGICRMSTGSYSTVWVLHGG